MALTASPYDGISPSLVLPQGKTDFNLPLNTNYTWYLSNVPDTTYVTFTWKDPNGKINTRYDYKKTIGNTFSAFGSDFNVTYNPPLGTSVISPSPVAVIPQPAIIPPFSPTLPTPKTYTWDLTNVPSSTYVNLSWTDAYGIPQSRSGIRATMGNNFSAIGSNFDASYNPPLGTSVIAPSPVAVVPTVIPPSAYTDSRPPIVKEKVNVIESIVSSLPTLPTLPILGGGGASSVSQDESANQKQNKTYWLYIIAGALILGYLLTSKKKPQ